jgi:pantoate--beta-alanine ligase
MRTIATIQEMQAAATAWRQAGLRIGFVPTMGFLHEGHLSLIDEARKRGADRVVVSIFVNPTQFGPKEDFSRYPRDLPRDAALCASRGTDVIFTPTVTEMYPAGSSTWVVEEALGGPLCGRSRPGHFRGVTTVVAKLFLAVLPDIAVFGQKDAQQAAIISRMVRDLNFPLTMVVAPTCREADGLAMSSRNAYLSPDDRQRAPAIYQGLQAAKAAYAAGERDRAALENLVRAPIEAQGARIDYVECVHGETLASQDPVGSPTLLAVAALFGKTRLIDNLTLRAE